MMFGDIYRGKRVLITGHTGFKGSWLALWLRELGADIIGYSLNPPSNPSHFDLLVSSNLLPAQLPSPDFHNFTTSQLHNFVSVIGDIRDADSLNDTFRTYRPEIVFHLAAQPLVRYSYKNPVETFETNVMGTINVFEACRQTESVKAIVNITSDKCYENRECEQGYCESDPMGGYDPYSASKGCAELVTNCYRRSFFGGTEGQRVRGSERQSSNLPALQPSSPLVLLSSARAGNVIGGGDWAEDRLIPDIMRAVGKDEKVVIRNPKSTRPWQHVLEPLSGYLALGQKLSEGRSEFAGGWNFGPDDESNIEVEHVVKKMKEYWNKIDYQCSPSQLHNFSTSEPHEAGILKLDCSKAHSKLGWKPVWDIKKTIETTTKWYKEFYENDRIMSQIDLDAYIKDAKNKKLLWTL